MALQLAELAVRYGCEISGNPDTEVHGVGTLEAAGAGQISFLANPLYRKHLVNTRASAVILKQEDAAECPVDCLVADDPYLVYARIAAELHPEPAASSGVHPAAVVADGATIAASAEISACAVVEEGARIGERVYLGPNSVIGRDAEIGDDTWIAPNVSIYARSIVGKRCRLHSGVVIGADGFGIAQSPQGWVKVPQVGRAILKDDVEIGAGTTVDRGAIEDTVLGNGVKLDNLVQIGHNVQIGDHTVMAAQSGVSGSTKVGARCVIGGKAAIAGHLEVADDVYLLGAAHVSKSIHKPGMYSSVITVEEASAWRRIAARIKSLDNFAKRLKALEKLSGSSRDGSD
jgi:UDP-3-O-[3-hydroxymyristoyl] glucosamine N-acyltransferase